MKRKIYPIVTITALIYLLTHNLTRKLFLDKPFDFVESITGAIVFSIVFYIVYKYLGKK